MTSINFTEWLLGWEEIGLFNVVLPFLLVFTISFAILEKSGILKQRNFNAVVSFVIALLFVRNQTLVGLVNNFLPNVSMFLVVILMFLLLIGIFGGKHKSTELTMGIAALVSFAFIVWSLFATNFFRVDWLPDWLAYMDEQTKTTILFIAVFVIVIWFVMREPKKSGDKGQGLKDLVENIGKGFGGGSGE